MMNIFFDRNAGRRIPQALALLDPPFRVKAHDDYFEQNTPDDEWLAQAGREGWIVVGFDRQFHRRRNELAALMAHGVGCFYLGGRKAKTWDRARIFMKVYERIAETVRKTPRPFVCRIDGLGAMQLVDLDVLDRIQEEAAPAKDDGRQPRPPG